MIGNYHIESLLSKFPNGKEKYNNSALFRNIIDSMLFSNASPYECIDKLVEIVEASQNTLKEYITKSDHKLITIYQNNI